MNSQQLKNKLPYESESESDYPAKRRQKHSPKVSKSKDSKGVKNSPKKGKTSENPNTVGDKTRNPTILMPRKKVANNDLSSIGDIYTSVSSNDEFTATIKREKCRKKKACLRVKKSVKKVR